jgi:hypothetical protein
MVRAPVRREKRSPARLLNEWRRDRVGEARLCHGAPSGAETRARAAPVICSSPLMRLAHPGVAMPAGHPVPRWRQRKTEKTPPPNSTFVVMFFEQLPQHVAVVLQAMDDFPEHCIRSFHDAHDLLMFLARFPYSYEPREHRFRSTTPTLPSETLSTRAKLR